jgi:hypothetical protein
MGGKDTPRYATIVSLSAAEIPVHDVDALACAAWQRAPRLNNLRHRRKRDAQMSAKRRQILSTRP